MATKEKQFSDSIFLLLRIIIEQNLPPTLASRLLYLYTSLVRIGMKIVDPHLKLCNNYKINTTIIKEYTKYYEYYKCYKCYKLFKNNYIFYISMQSLIIIRQMFPNSKILNDFILNNTINKNDENFRNFLMDKKILKQINAELKNFYLYTNNDGWLKSDEEVKLKNDYYIDPEIQIDVNKISNQESWCLLKGQKMLSPKWGEVTGLLTNNQSTKIETYLDDKYRKIKNVKENKKVLDISIELTDKQKMSAEFWAGIGGSVSPPGFWTMFLYCYFKTNKRCNSTQVDFFYKLTCALFQASITVWKIKYKYLQPRPIQCIRLNYTYEKFNYYFGYSDGITWKPYQESQSVSPPFPDYISGHSTFSSTGAYILNNLIGSNIEKLNIDITTCELQMLSPVFNNQSCKTFKLNEIIIDKNSSGIQENVPADKMTFVFSSWTEMALEAGRSRIFGGIHSIPSHVEGLQAGKYIGCAILNNFK